MESLESLEILWKLNTPIEGIGSKTKQDQNKRLRACGFVARVIRAWTAIGIAGSGCPGSSAAEPQLHKPSWNCSKFCSLQSVILLTHFTFFPCVVTSSLPI